MMLNELFLQTNLFAEGLHCLSMDPEPELSHIVEILLYSISGEIN